MSAQRSSRPGRRRNEEEPVDAQDQDEKREPDNQVSADSADALDEIDRVLDEFDGVIKEELGFGKNQEVTPKELEDAAEVAIRNYVQKGGQ